MRARILLVGLCGLGLCAGEADAQSPAASTAGQRAQTVGSISAPPVSLGNYDSVETAFGGDWSHGHGEEYRITGLDTLGRPRTGYRFTPEATPHYLYLYNASGWNQDTGGNGGRTAASAYRTQGFQAGQGDLILNSASCFVTGSRPGATSFLANPACTLFAGDTFAGRDGVYLNPVEIDLDDQGHDAAGIAYVANLKRTNGAGALEAVWAGVRLQSVGSVPADVAWSATGRWNLGLDLTAVNLGANQAAITLKRGQRIYGDAVDNDPIARFPTALGADYLVDDPAVRGWRVVAGGRPALQVTSTQVTATEPLVSTFQASSVGVSSATLGPASSVGVGARVTCATGHDCDAQSGEFTLTTGAGLLAAGDVLTVAFADARAASPNCIVQGQLGMSATVPVAKSEGPSRLTFNVASALSAGTTYTFTYACGGR